MLKLKLILILAIVAIVNANTLAQAIQSRKEGDFVNAQNNSIEVAAYSVANISANIVFVSFSIKEYESNGKIVTLAEQDKKLKQAVKDIGYEESNLKVMNLLGFSTFTMNGEPSTYEKTRSYLLKLRGVNCIDKFLAKSDMKLLNNFSIESFDHDDIFTEIRKIQLEAYERAKQKTDNFLEVYGKKRGDVLNIEEVSLHIVYPKISGHKGNIHQIIGMNSGTEYIEMPTNNLQDIRIEYQAKVVFEIITDNDKNNK